MSKLGWIIGLVVAGVVIAVLIGVLGNSQSVASTKFCSDLDSLGSSVSNLTSLNATTATQGDFQSDVSSVQSAWGGVKSSAQDLHSVNMGSLQKSWDGFSSALQNVTAQSSVSDAEQAISQAASDLQSTVKSNLSSYDCSGS